MRGGVPPDSPLRGARGRVSVTLTAPKFFGVSTASGIGPSFPGMHNLGIGIATAASKELLPMETRYRATNVCLPPLCRLHRTLQAVRPGIVLQRPKFSEHTREPPDGNCPRLTGQVRPDRAAAATDDMLSSRFLAEQEPARTSSRGLNCLSGVGSSGGTQVIACIKYNAHEWPG